MLAVSVPAVTGVGSAAAASAAVRAQDQAQDPALALDQLSTTIGDLRASLSTIRQDLEALRGASGDPPDTDRLCAAPLAGVRAERDAAAQALERLRAQVGTERAEWRSSEAATAGELASLRERLADAGADAARLHGERGTLVRRIGELERALTHARTSEVVAALVRRSPASPIESAAAAEVEATPYAAEPAQTGAAVSDAPAGADGGGDLQLRAELALAELKIGDLTAELRSAQAGREAIEAEIRSLRSLTDAKIKHFMGWR